MNRAAAEPLILASRSRIRRTLMENAGLQFTVEPADVDESGMKRSGRGEGLSAGQMSELLAEVKARRVASRGPGALVVGVDQILEFDSTWYEKAETVEEARERLWSLRGRQHALVASIVVMKEQHRIWHVTEEVVLTMREFSVAFLDQYIKQAGSELTESVGCYAFEGLGVQLFTSVQGNYFTLLGLPLLPLLGFLRQRGVLVA